MCSAKIEGVEDSNDILNVQEQRIGSRVMRFVTCSMPPGIHEDELVVGFQAVDIPGPRPTLDTPGKPVLKDQEWAFALDLVVDTDSVVADIWDDPPPIKSGWRWLSARIRHASKSL